MTDITINSILKFIKVSKKIKDMEEGKDSLYHIRIGLNAGLNGPYIDFKYSMKFMSTDCLQVVYNGESIFQAQSKEAILIKQAIENRKNELKEEAIEKKKQEFLKIVEDI